MIAWDDCDCESKPRSKQREMKLQAYRLTTRIKLCLIFLLVILNESNSL